MLIELNVVFQDDHILISFNDGSPSIKLSNTIGYDQNNQLVSIGDSLDDLIKKKPQDEQKIKTTLHFEKIYDVSATALKRTELFFEYQLAKTHAEKAGSYNLGFFDRIVCRLQMSNYDLIEEKARKTFEYSLNTLMFIPVRTLEINDKSRGWSRWQILLARQSYLLILYSVMFIIPGVLLVVADIPPLQTIVLAGIALGVAIGFYYILGILWALLMRSLLPRDLLRQTLYAEAHRGQKKPGWFQDWLLKSFLQDTIE